MKISSYPKQLLWVLSLALTLEEVVRSWWASALFEDWSFDFETLKPTSQELERNRFGFNSTFYHECLWLKLFPDSLF